MHQWPTGSWWKSGRMNENERNCFYFCLWSVTGLNTCVRILNSGRFLVLWCVVIGVRWEHLCSFCGNVCHCVSSVISTFLVPVFAAISVTVYGFKAPSLFFPRLYDLKKLPKVSLQCFSEQTYRKALWIFLKTLKYARLTSGWLLKT